MKPRPLIIKQDHALVPLTQGKLAVIDLNDVELISQSNWHFEGAYGVRLIYREGKCRAIYIHRTINNTPDGFETDHINGNKLDNRKGNLRTVTAKQNQHNQMPRKGCSSRYKGVSWASGAMVWKACIKINGKNKHIGNFDCEFDAGKAYDVFAVKEYGEYASLNFNSCVRGESFAVNRD